MFNERLVQATSVLVTILMFLAALALNTFLFSRFEFAPGINWFYLPAGVRLLATLLFAEEGAIGLLIVSWFVSFALFFPNDPARAFVGGIVATVAPYGVYRVASKRWGLQRNLANLTPARLLVLALGYALASPFLHHVWFALRGDEGLVPGFLAMFIGDLNGTLLVLYAAKVSLALLPRLAR